MKITIEGEIPDEETMEIAEVIIKGIANTFITKSIKVFRHIKNKQLR